MPPILLIADDLTGACDAAVAFAQRGLATHVLLDPAHALSPQPELLAIDTATRDLPPAQAAATLHQLASRHAPPLSTPVFKKIDSVLRGNTFHEIRAALEAFPHRLAVLAPAYPALGRTSSGGHLHIDDLSGRRSLPVRESLAALGLHPTWIGHGQSPEAIAESMSQSLASGNALVFCDAHTPDDLHATVRAALSLGHPLLWIGSGGLAHAVASQLPARPAPEPPRQTGLTLLFLGSDHPVTLAQRESLLAQGLARRQQILTWPCALTPGATPAAAAILIPVRMHPAAVRTPLEDLRAVAAALQSHAVSCLFMTGGDTAAHVCRALGIAALRLTREFEPGIPQAVALGGPFDGRTVLLKSGGFGRPDLLCRIATRFTFST